MKAKDPNDIADLKDDALVRREADYVDFGRQKRSRKALERWPLLSELNAAQDVEAVEGAPALGVSGAPDKKPVRGGAE